MTLTGAIKDHVVGVDHLVDYLLFILNKKEQYRYVELLNMDGPTTSTDLFLRHASQRLQKNEGGVVEELSSEQFDRAAKHLIQLYREGKFGRFMLDDL